MRNEVVAYQLPRVTPPLAGSGGEPAFESQGCWLIICKSIKSDSLGFFICSGYKFNNYQILGVEKKYFFVIINCN
jgi:hypothetical protein